MGSLSSRVLQKCSSQTRTLRKSFPTGRHTLTVDLIVLSWILKKLGLM